MPVVAAFTRAAATPAPEDTAFFAERFNEMALKALAAAPKPLDAGSQEGVKNDG